MCKRYWPCARANCFVLRVRFGIVVSADPFAHVRLVVLLPAPTLLHPFPKIGDFARHHFLGLSAFGCSSTPPQVVVAEVEFQPTLAVLTESRVRAGLPLERSDDNGLGSLLNQFSFSVGPVCLEPGSNSCYVR